MSETKICGCINKGFQTNRINRIYMPYVSVDVNIPIDDKGIQIQMIGIDIDMRERFVTGTD